MTTRYWTRGTYVHVTTLLVLLSSFAAVFCSSGIVQAEEFKLSFTGATSIIEGSGEILAPDLIQGRGQIKFNVFVLLTSVQSQQEIDDALEETLNLPACKDLEDPPPGCRNHVGAQAWSFSVAVGSNALITGVSSTDENGEAGL